MSLSGEATAGLVLGLLGLIAVVSLLFYTHRRFQITARGKRGIAGVEDTEDRLPDSTSVSVHHPASRIVPFGPSFVHKPGADMRVATLSPNGVWEFSSPSPSSPSPLHTSDPFARVSIGDPFSRIGTPDPYARINSARNSIDPFASPSSSRTKKKSMSGWGDTDSYLEPPPPAYYREP